MGLTSLSPWRATPPDCSTAAREGSSAFAALLKEHLVCKDSGEEKTGKQLASGIEAGLVDSSCIHWVYCETAVQRQAGAPPTGPTT